MCQTKVCIRTKSFHSNKTSMNFYSSTLAHINQRERATTFFVHSRRLYRKLVCALFGHKVNNLIFQASNDSRKRCDCGVEFLQENGRETRISHTVSCFLFGHSYERVCARNGHVEFVCRQCGHPLLFETAQRVYAEQRAFRKKVRYLCNLFGHRVHSVVERDGFTEYACRCGHTFLKQEKHRSFIKHPPVCLFAGHYVSYVSHRAGYAEFLCRNCGHTFCFTKRPLNKKRCLMYS